MDVQNLDTVVCVLDQAIYSKACEIKWEELLKFQGCILMMGIFHLHMVFMSILNKRFGDAGLRDALVQSSIVAEGVDSALPGKSYNRGIRLYKIYREALTRLLLKQLEDEAPEMYKEFSSHVDQTDTMNAARFEALKSESSFEQLFNSYLNLRIKLGSSNFSLQRFWLSFLEMMELLLSLIYSVRLGKWDLLLECIRSIIPFTFTYDHINYARYLPGLLGEMLSLEDDYLDIYERFKASEFSAQLSNESSFSRCESDKVIEMTLNKGTKTPDGTTGFSTSANAVRRWEVNASYGANLRTCFHKHLDYNQQKYKHKDISPSRIRRDERDIISVMTVLTEAFIDPFGERPLVGIYTGIEIPQSLSDDILAAKEKGQEAMDDFIQKRLEGDKPHTNFFDPISKMKLATFSSLHKTMICKTKNKVIALKSNKDLFGKIAIIAQKRSVGMRYLFKYPLVPLALAEKDDTLKKTTKSVLLNKLEGGMVTIEELPSNYCMIIDGMAAVRQRKASSLTYKEFAEKLLKSVIKTVKNTKRINVVFDVYLNNSIKGVERNRRSHGELMLNQKLPTSQIKQ